MFLAVGAHASDSARILSLHQQGIRYMEAAHFDSSAFFFDQALYLARDNHHHFYEAELLYSQSRLHELQHELPLALETLGQAVSIFERLGLRKHIANCYNSYNRIYQTLGNYTAALEYGLRALRIKEALNDQRGASIALTNIGNIYLLTSRYEEAIRSFERALLIDSTAGDAEGVSISLLNIGVAYQKRGDYPNALTRYNESLVITRQLGNTVDEAWVLGNIGSTLRQMGKADSSLIVLFQALELLTETKSEQAHTLNDIAETYQDLGNVSAAETYSRLAVEAAQRERNMGQLGAGYLNLSTSYSRSGDYQRAYEWLQRHNVIRDSLTSIEKEKQLSELQIRYQSEKKEQTIASLQQEHSAAVFRRNTYLVVGGLLAIILLLLYRYQRIAARKSRQLYEKGLEVDSMKSVFFSNISHEFRTPLTLIQGATQQLQEDLAHAATGDRLATIERNAARLLVLVDQLLDLSKLDSGKLTLTPESVDILSITKGTLMSFQSQAVARQIDLQLQSEMETLPLQADKEKVETILINLLSNAFKFTPDGGCITVTLEITEKNGTGYCRVSVEDTGAGISANELPHVFDRFYQGTPTYKTQHSGSGIGLALAKVLVELHRGYITASSEVSGGTRISFFLPLEPCLPGEPGAPAASLPVSPAEAREDFQVADNGSGMPEDTVADHNAPGARVPSVTFSVSDSHARPTVLLIEDNEEVRYYLREILERHYTIIEAADGVAGISLARKAVPDLIISDVMMPEKNGWEVCETLKQEEATSHIPLVLLTARASSEDRLLGLQRQADDYLSKPFSSRELLTRVGNLIHSRRLLREKFGRLLALQPADTQAESLEEAFLQRIMQVVEERMADEDFSVAQLAREAGMSRSQLHRKLQALTGHSATGFIRGYRLTRARDMLRKHSGSISEIAYQVGFSSPSYFSKMFQREFGISPGQVRPKAP